VSRASEQRRTRRVTGDSAVLSERERTIPTEFEPTASAV
jgi:hypothetical protein